MGDLISRQATYETLSEYYHHKTEMQHKALREALGMVPSAEPSYAQSIGKCETCYYWGNRIMMRDGSLGDCGNFGVSLSKDFFCAWWSQRENEGEQDEL